MKRPIPTWAQRVLHRYPDIEILPGPGDTWYLGVDGERRGRILVECRRELGLPQAWTILTNRRPRTDSAGILVLAERSAAKARDRLRNAKIGYLDGQGNANLRFPGIFVHTQATDRTPAPKVATRLSGKAGVVAQALLLEPHRTWSVTELARVAGVSMGLTHRVLSRLEAEHILRVEGAGPAKRRKLANGPALLDLWAEEEKTRGERAVYGYSFATSPWELMAEISGTLDDESTLHAVTGAAATDLLAPILTAVRIVHLWVGGAVNVPLFMQAARIEEVTSGHNIVVKQAADDTPCVFRRKHQNVWLANPIRIYLDLLGDPQRGKEQAEHLRKEVIGL